MNWWRHVIAAEVRKILAYRTDFWVSFFGQTFIQLLIAHALWSSIFESTGNKVMEGFTLETMTLYYLIVPVGQKMLTGENIGFVAREIYDGSFNRYLIYPISFFDYKTITYLTYSVFYGLQLALIYVIYLLAMDSFTMVTAANLCAGIFMFMLASFAYVNLAIMIELISLWADNIWTLMVMTRFVCFFFGGGFVPIDFFPAALQKILIFTPFPYLVNLPVKVTMGLASREQLLIGLVVLISWAFLFRFMAKMIWKKGQYKYEGVGI